MTDTRDPKSRSVLAEAAAETRQEMQEIYGVKYTPLTSAELADIKAKAKAAPIYSTATEWVELYDEILCLIDMIERRDAWQPVETAPPTEADGLFLAFVPPYIMGCALVENGKIVWPREGESEEAHGVTKWQPLPAPPSEALAATEPSNG